MPRRRSVLAAAAAIPLLAACSESSADTGDTTAGDATSETAVGTRTVTHEFGTTDVPLDPRRVVVLDGDVLLEPVVALGITVVGAVTPSLTGAFSDAVAALLPSDVVEVGTDGLVDVEAVLALDPDLVIVNKDQSDAEQVYAQISAVVPTVAPVRTIQFDWQGLLTEIAAVFGREDAAAELLADYEQVVADATLPPDLGTVSVVRLRTDTVRYLTAEGAYPWSVLGALGVEAPPQQARGDDETPFVNVSLEELPLIDGDVILVLADAGTRQDALPRLEALESFRSLGARLVVVDSAEYIFGNVLTAERIVEELPAVLAG